MPDYLGIQKEETLKARVFDDYFDRLKHAYAPDIDNIDFVAAAVTMPAAALFPEHFLWAEAKKGIADISDMLTQLLLTCKKTVDRGLHLPPPYLGCFDSQKIAFVPFYAVLPIFVESDVNWNTVPHDHATPDFQKLRGKVEKLIAPHLEVFNFETDTDAIKAFIKNNVHSGAPSAKVKINKNNFVHIFYKWVKQVKPYINISDNHWAEYKRQGIFDCDFFRADLMSAPAARELGEIAGNFSTKFSSITEKLEIILREDTYDVPKLINNLQYHTAIDWTDDGEAYRKFWSKYERPPAEEYREYIVRRRDLLVDQNIREIRGEFFTPPEWVELSQEYLARAFGENWQKEYYIWDCCAGNGNLLVGLQEPERIWASDISNANVKNMVQLAHDRHTLRESHIFQFDFLNDYFEVPKKGRELEVVREKAGADVQKLKDSGLYEILTDKEKIKKLIIYINPPYTETMSKRGTDKTGLNLTMINAKYALSMRNCANRELFVQFLTRIYFEIPDCVIAHFSTLKILNAPHFINFREYFMAKLLKLFIVPADTFDNVTGKFPIGFYIWNTSIKEKIINASADVYNKDTNFIGTKIIQHYDDVQLINKWIITTRNRDNEKKIGFLSAKGNDFQNANYVYIVNKKTILPVPRGTWITDKNLIEICLYFAARKALPATWLNDRDQFLYPNDGWKGDAEFQTNCLIYTLFNNNISCKHGVNHWIPFTEEELGVNGEFKSHFMSDYLKRIGDNQGTGDRGQGIVGAECKPSINAGSAVSTDRADKALYPLPSTPYPLSKETAAVLAAGRALFRYYHETTRDNKKAPVDASFYDIREFFQGHNEKGKMNSKSADDKYTVLLTELRAAQKTLTQKIAPKIYEYGFLRE